MYGVRSQPVNRCTPLSGPDQITATPALSVTNSKLIEPHAAMPSLEISPCTPRQMNRHALPVPSA
jgi:hypothetical protein